MKPGSPQWEARVAQLEAQEANVPECIWYISFASEEEWLGACFVRGRGVVTATKQAHQQGCNPGGQAKMVPLKGADIPELWMNRLLSKNDLTKMDKELFGEEGGPIPW